MSRLFMVRHGQASFGSGNYDVLSPLGEEQARRLGAHWAEHEIVFDLVFSGPRQRHQRTAAIVGAAMSQRGLPWPEPVAVPEFDEYAGLEVFQVALANRQNHAQEKKPEGSELLKLFQQTIARWVRGELDVPGVETWTQFRARARRGLERMIASNQRGRRIAVFTSTGPVAAALDLAFGLDDVRLMEASWQLRNTAVSEFMFSAPRFALSVFNALPHLPPGELVTHI